MYASVIYVVSCLSQCQLPGVEPSIPHPAVSRPFHGSLAPALCDNVRAMATPRFVTLSQYDPKYKTPAVVVVSVAHIVKIEPAYYERKGETIFPTMVVTPGADELALERHYHVYDVLGNRYVVPPDAIGRRTIDELWRSAIANEQPGE